MRAREKNMMMVVDEMLLRKDSVDGCHKRGIE